MDMFSGTRAGMAEPEVCSSGSCSSSDAGTDGGCCGGMGTLELDSVAVLESE